MTGCILSNKAAEYHIPIGFGQIDRIQRNVELFTYLQGIGNISLGSAITGPVVALPVFHEQALQRIAPLFEQQRSHRGIDAAGNGNNDGGCD